MGRNPRIVTEIDDPVGRKLTFKWTATATIQSIADPLGRTVSYTYNSDYTLASYTNVLGGVTKYTYDSQQRLVTVTDPRGVVTESNTYDANGRIATQTNAAGGTLKFVSSPGDPVTFAYVLTNALVPSSPVTQATYQDPLGNRTVYRFNTVGYVVAVTDATGQTRNFNRAPGTNMITSITGNGRCPVSGDPRAGGVAFTYDPNGNPTSITDDLNHTTSISWDPVFGKPVWITDPLGNVTKLVYDAGGILPG